MDCKFSVMNVSPQGLIDQNSRVCRRMPPTPVGIPSPTGIEIRSFWPMVGLSDSCHSFERRNLLETLNSIAPHVGLKAN